MQTSESNDFLMKAILDLLIQEASLSMQDNSEEELSAVQQKLKHYRTILAANHSFIPYSMAGAELRGKCLPYISIDEVAAEGRKGLLRAVETYIPNPCTAFGSYAHMFVKDYIRRFLVSLYLEKRDVVFEDYESCPQIVSETDLDEERCSYGTNTIVESIFTQDETDFINPMGITREMFNRAFSQLDKKGAYVLSHMFCLNNCKKKSVNELSKELGKSVAKIYRIVNQAKIILRHYLLLEIEGEKS